MRFSVLPVMTLFLGLSMADMHDYCACQYKTNSAVDYAATDLLAGDRRNSYTYGQNSGQFWIGRSSGSGPRFQGRFLKAISGQIDGNEFYNNCKRYAANDATCFDCDFRFEYPDGSTLCR
ncbi:hypothetical protein BDP55DRAFT_641301 [Colletotrichum godetiae]|uniref:Secreted in xylem 5 n=1 Tax=Colletotrichum godetiae TaxID=1209918 RepID=A0AAJ0B1H0_9PEZI|nr:uncharacterized protein BDP55DRAFT_641301 [Colletotrichum godetiae]KAK1701347.1 hypothetical protein BDP55DRAFT_641301 [Colletotrichum godetiae]